MSATPTPPAEPTASTTAVPYGPPATESALSPRSISGKSVAKVAFRFALPFLIRAVLRAASRR